jgi:hypothetical protein
MPVVINDFEVVAEPPSPSESGQGATNNASDQGKKTSLEELLERLCERMERVRAH